MSQSTRPVLGYLTETWTPPASCLTVDVIGAKSTWANGWAGVTCDNGGNLNDATDCWPPRTANAPNVGNGAFLAGWGFYSPGTICPSGYTTACQATYGQPVSGWEVQFPLTTGETAVGCCPSGGYTCHWTHPDAAGTADTTMAQTCLLLASSTVLGLSPCTSSATTDTGFEVLSVTLPYQETITTASTTSTAAIKTLTAQAPLIQINWRSEDLIHSTSPVSSSAAASTNNNNNNGSAGTISGGAIAGIVVGIFVVLAGIAAGVFFLIRRRRKHHRKTREEPPPPPPPEYPHQPKAELATSWPPAELHGQGLTPHPQELPTTTTYPTEQEEAGRQGSRGRFLAEVPG